MATATSRYRSPTEVKACVENIHKKRPSPRKRFLKEEIATGSGSRVRYRKEWEDPDHGSWCDKHSREREWQKAGVWSRVGGRAHGFTIDQSRGVVVTMGCT